MNNTQKLLFSISSIEDKIKNFKHLFDEKHLNIVKDVMRGTRLTVVGKKFGISSEEVNQICCNLYITIKKYDYLENPKLLRLNNDFLNHKPIFKDTTTTNALHASNIDNYRDLCKRSYAEMLRVPGVGKTRLNKLEEELKVLDLCLGMEDDEFNLPYGKRIFYSEGYLPNSVCSNLPFFTRLIIKVKNLLGL